MVQQNRYFPEGTLLQSASNNQSCASIGALEQALEERRILEGRVTLCDTAHNLQVELGGFTGIIPRSEVAVGIDSGATREIAIISRVGKPVSFMVQSIGADRYGKPRILLSRRAAQEAAISYLMKNLLPGTVIPATVTHLEPFGAFVDIGCGIVSMIGIENISVSRIPHPCKRFSVGQKIFAAVLEVDRCMKRIHLTHKELLGTWEENAAMFSVGETVPGVVRGIKEYGAFIELAPNLSGLAELRQCLCEGGCVSVYIKAILPERMKIKLLVIDALPELCEDRTLSYFITEGRLREWNYSPASCLRSPVRTVFGDGELQTS
ncbi:S1 RNA-binding domain-containing protein [Papillibacter cinnamivorans]|uniref:Small subunit ribosomal protein S1 n=1 Tax=Papillibacter cinnamivorans DSM 12816 TaxID=1122930 RepID=A0A1W1YLB9_9FIRM|nr:S1 RNA-binding domain-containing protein [Papillibacter cinnamivorans]SMC36913.1 small subunit ribosomal protein S1 [Papillibacter cinnamivorans DSM 12816]